MKQFLKKIVQGFLELLVKIKLSRCKAKIIGVTGSIGKTTVKEATYEVLKIKWRVYRNPKSLNTEMGMLLAVLEQESGFSNPAKWIYILFRAVVNAFAGKKYDFLVLEYGADKPGDIQHLTSIVKPHMGIITKISRVHQDEGQFKDAEDVFNEKKKLVTCLHKEDVAILNYNDKFLRRLQDEKLHAKIFWFNKDISADNLRQTASGFSADINAFSKNEHAEFGIPGIYHTDVLLPALLCGILNGVTLKEGVKALKNFRLPAGRMSIIHGKNNSTILDSSYNASPETMRAALDLLRDFPGKRKIAVLGTMNELGGYIEEGHQEVGDAVGPWLDMLITVGSQASIIAERALKNGLPQSRIKTLLTAEQSAEFLLQEGLLKDDIILFKGSQNRVRLERAVKMLMANPAEAKHLLCRQGLEWEKIN